ncbi:MAG: hypothetical protein LBD11_02090 [Candidatus Peribacteria bacterium]|jgi:magnesium-transporting ATPase (P-type)|nr:hypothetical protein [Candidatus Peribacteria bacterium]
MTNLAWIIMGGVSALLAFVTYKLQLLAEKKKNETRKGNEDYQPLEEMIFGLGVYWIIFSIWACFSLGFGFGKEWYPNEEAFYVGLIGFCITVLVAIVMWGIYEIFKAILKGKRYLSTPKKDEKTKSNNNLKNN